MQMLPPFFVIGSPRSGTSLFRLMLTCHPELVVPPESGFMLWLHADYGSWNEEHINTRLDKFLDDLFSARKMETWKLARDRVKELIVEVKPCTYAELAACVYVSYSRQKGKISLRRWGDKNNYYLNHIDLIDALFPQCCFIHIVRDPRSTTLSFLDLAESDHASPYAPDLPTTCRKAAERWVADIVKIRKGLMPFRESGRVYELRYEDLVKSSEGELRGVCRFLSVAFAPIMLDYYMLNRSKNLEPNETLSWKMRTLSSPDPTRIDRYRKKLTLSQIQIIEEVAGSEMHQYGYR